MAPAAEEPWWRGEGLHPAASWLAALVLAAAHWAAAVRASEHNAVTFDEVAHVAGGLGATLLGDYRLNPENGILPQSLAAAAMTAGGVRLPEVSNTQTHPGMAWLYSDSWELGFTAIYQGDVDAQRVMLLGRGACALCGAGTVLVVHAAARWVHRGEAFGALIPTLLAASCPTMLAHGPLVTSDGTFTFFITLSTACLYGMLYVAAEGRRGPAVLAVWSVAVGLAVGGTIVSKHSGVVVAPLAVFILLLRLATRKARTLSFAARSLPCIAVSIVVAWAAVWGAYGFRYGAFAHGDCVQWKSNWDQGLGSTHGALTGLPLELTNFAREHRLLPEALLYGIGYAFLSAQARAAFLAGAHSTRGWRTFFPYAVMVKTPVGVFVLILLSILCWAKLKGVWAGSTWPMKAGAPRPLDITASKRFLPFAAWWIFYWAIAINQNLNIGHRHMLPIYPATYILCGFAGRAFASLRTQKRPPPFWFVSILRLAVLAAVASVVYEVWGVYPYFLAFFNKGVGGPANGYKHLVDSSLDWGQGLPALQDFIVKESANASALRAGGDEGPVHFYVSYFGLGNPLYWNVSRESGYEVNHIHSSVSGVSVPKHLKELNLFLAPGYYAIAASMLQPVYNKHAPGNWNAYYETTYRRQARFINRLQFIKQPMRTQILMGQYPGLQDMPKMMEWYDAFRAARLSAFFRETEPYAQPGYAFNVYRVDRDTLRRYLFGPAPKETALNDISFLSVSVN